MVRTELEDRGKDKIPYHLQQNLRQLAVDLARRASDKLPAGRTSVKWKEGEISYEARMGRKNGEFFPLSFEADFRGKNQKGRIEIGFNDKAEIRKISLSGTCLSLLETLVPSDALSCSIPLENLDFTNPQGIEFQVSRKKFSLPSFRHGDEDTSLFIKARDLLFLIKTVQARLAPAE